MFARFLSGTGSVIKSSTVARTEAKLASAATAFSKRSRPTEAVTGAGASSGPTAFRANVDKLKNAKDKVKLASLVARTANSWSSQPTPTSQACQIL